MKYILLINANTAPGSAPGCSSVEDWMTYEKEMKEAGVYVSGHAMADLTTATAVRVDATTGERTVTDGPYAESHEVLGGYDVIDVPDLDAALEWATRCPGSKDGGTVIVRPLAEF
ncbi:YciI family protein [Rhodococcus sp. IEGM 1381]|uniref:YciI family protein n=1 Tax=Rhodococcus sp. IEGM 1381 TaxID=3047085 RepID=UPI0024B70B3F|nr:YciI family protein [Rhodococcus sp. IEGM 1381]MDI9895356.1 YciI family protein [Rhodococcus sp. IEGM 1381]